MRCPLYLHYSFHRFICTSVYLTCRFSRKMLNLLMHGVADTNNDANTSVCWVRIRVRMHVRARARARKRKRKRRSKSWDGLLDGIPEVLARRFQAQNDPPLISAGVLFAIFITMSTSSPLFRESLRDLVRAVCTFSNSVQKCLPPVSLVSLLY